MGKRLLMRFSICICRVRDLVVASLQICTYIVLFPFRFLSKTIQFSFYSKLQVDADDPTASYMLQMKLAYAEASSKLNYNLTDALLFLSHFVGDVHQISMLLKFQPPHKFFNAFF
ncbi:uncharacterized protein LOC131593592 [Vicia villosa]|uniref:uncharacterized protein LOC131593592 n=1 Tax=Vicia villosa TaxID=3911 RepID=UPI00273B7734|nr:uncharacterized protein LOC131593592 [Vicia villosa]